MKTGKPIIICIDLDLLLVVDDEMNEIGDLIYVSSVFWCEIHFIIVLNRLKRFKSDSMYIS